MPLPLYQSKPLSTIQCTLAVAAGKGGVGKSSVTVNLALALKAQGFQVGIMDTDLYGPSIRKMLPEDRLPSQKGEIIQPALCSGIKMISMAYFVKVHEAAAVRAPIANTLINQFIKNVEWGALDFLIVDFPPGTGDIQLTLSQKAHLTAAIMVTTPQEVALLDVRKAMHMFGRVKVPILGVVENMSYYLIPRTQERVYIFGQGGGERLSQEANIPFLGAIPLDDQLCQWADKGLPLLAMDSNQEREATQAFMQLAQQVVGQLALLKTLPDHHLSDFELIWQEMPS